MNNITGTRIKYTVFHVNKRQSENRRFNMLRIENRSYLQPVILSSLNTIEEYRRGLHHLHFCKSDSYIPIVELFLLFSHSFFFLLILQESTSLSVGSNLPEPRPSLFPLSSLHLTTHTISAQLGFHRNLGDALLASTLFLFSNHSRQNSLCCFLRSSFIR